MSGIFIHSNGESHSEGSIRDKSVELGNMLGVWKELCMNFGKNKGPVLVAKEKTRSQKGPCGGKLLIQGKKFVLV